MTETRIIPPAGGRGGGKAREIDPAQFPEEPRPPQTDNVKGAQFGMLKARWFAGLNIQGRAMWACECMGCGKWVLVSLNNLRQHNTRSCGECQRLQPKPVKKPVQMDPYRASLVRGLSKLLQKAEEQK